MNKLFVSSISGFFAYLFISMFPIAYAQMLPANSLTVNPSLLQLDLGQDKPEGTITYINTSNQTIQISLSASDFAPLEDGYKISFFNQQDAANYHYSLSSWVDFSTKTLIISPHSSEHVTVFIDKDKLTPGGHYASIFAEIAGDQENTVKIRGVLASLLFVRTNTGHERNEATIAGFFPEQYLWDFPKTFVLRLNDTGDTTLTPYGLITITDHFGNYVAKGVINTGSNQVLPESIRRFTTPIQSLSAFFLPGMYTAHLTLHTGTIQKEITVTFFSFGSIPMTQIFIVLVTLGIILILFRKKLPLKRPLNK